MARKLTGLYKLAADVAPSITKRAAVTAWPEQPGVPTAPVEQPKRLPGLAFDPDAHLTTGTPPMMPMLGGPANAVAAAGGRAMQAAGNGMRAAVRAAPTVGAKVLRGAGQAARGIGQAAKWVGRNWWRPGQSMIESPVRAVRNVGRAYRALLGTTQTVGPWAMSAQSDETLSKLPSWAKKLPAYTQLLSPGGLRNAAVSYLAGRGMGARPDLAASAGETAARAGKNIAQHSFASDEVPLSPRLGRWSPSTRENFTKGVVDELGRVSPALGDKITGAASNAYDQVSAQLPPEVSAELGKRMPWTDVKQKLEDFYPLSPSEKLEKLKAIPGAVTQGLETARENLPQYVAETYGNMTPEEQRAAMRLGQDVRYGIPTANADYRDLRQIFGTNDVNRVGLAGNIAARTIPLAGKTMDDIQEAARLYRERMANQQRPMAVGE